MSACVSPPQERVSHIVQVAAIMAAAASTAFPPRSKIIAPAVAAIGLPGTAIQWLPWSGGFSVRICGKRGSAVRTMRTSARFLMRRSLWKNATVRHTSSAEGGLVMPNRCTVVYQNLSDHDVSDVLVLLRNTRSNVAFAPPVAWQVFRNDGRRSFHKFIHTPDVHVKVAWEGGILTADAVDGAVYDVKERDGQSVLDRTDVSLPNGMTVLNDLPSPGGIDVTLYRDGKPVMMQRGVPYGARAEFGLESTIWVALVNDVVEGETQIVDSSPN